MRRQLRARAARDDVHLRGGGGRGGIGAWDDDARRTNNHGMCRRVPSVSAENARGKTHRAGQRLGRDVVVVQARRMHPDECETRGSTVRPRASRLGLLCRDLREGRTGASGRRFGVSARRASGKERARAFRSLRRGHVASDGAGAITETRATMASAIAALPVSRVVPVPRAHRRAARRSLVVVAGKKGAWAKEFDEEYIKKNAPVETVDDGWPGLDSACRARPHFARARNLLHIHRARARIVRHSRISATLAPSSRSPRDEKAPCASRLSALRRPLTPSPPPSTSQRIRRRTPRRTTSS